MLQIIAEENPQLMRNSIVLSILDLSVGQYTAWEA